ncbi:MAG: YdcF family protein [Firmicutes bacterium]|nr:YdcF family protein [Candidatus Colimorpha enterica]
MIINCIVLSKTKKNILTEEEAAKLTDVDCILVLGCGVKSDGTPSDMLHDRVKVGIRVFDTGVTDRILMSGDHGRTNYDEVNAMKKMATDSGIDPDEVFLDHAGFSTYESMYRAKEIFCVKKMIIVTQEYHLSRAIYIARALGIEAYGVSADERNYRNQTYRELREAVARVKDVFYCIAKPKPTYLGKKIPITEKGSRTDG